MTELVAKLQRLRNVGVLSDITSAEGGPEFVKFNVIYGFNGCGKTTISRIFDSISAQGLSLNLPESADFLIRFSDGQEASPRSLITTSSDNICVFSEDFVDRALAWKDASANPIVYLGEGQAGLAERLSELEAQELEASSQQLVCATEWGAADKAEIQHCTNTARLISEELGIVRSYDARNLRRDYELDGLGPDGKVSDQERANLKRNILQVDAPTKLDPFVADIDLVGTVHAVRHALGLELETIAIEALERRKDALPWVERGLELHEDEADCLFCGNELSSQRKGQLKEALSNSFQIVSEALAKVQRTVQDVREVVGAKTAILGSPLAVASSLSQREEEARTALLSLMRNVSNSLDDLLTVIAERIADPSREQRPPDVDVCKAIEEEIDRSVGTLNNVINAHNEVVDDYQNQKTADRERLKRHYLSDTLNEHKNLCALRDESKSGLDDADRKLKQIRTEIGQIRNEMREHGPAADRMNELIASYLGHNRITIAADDQGYRICRDGVPLTKPLSEGEKTAIAFCYFIVSLESEGRKIDDLIVVIDDPVSSLDTRAMAHAVSLIKFSIGKCAQLFVLTHNLDFLREMKKWLISRRKSGESEFYFLKHAILEDGRRSSTFTDLPAIIREYESEYHYLFSLIYNAAHDREEVEKYSYLLPNALRKVLETYLAFKQPGLPDLAGLTPLIAAHGGVDAMKVRALEALAQTESHAQSIGDSITFSQFTMEQIADAARSFLHLVEATDPMHFERMDKLCRRAA